MPDSPEPSAGFAGSELVVDRRYQALVIDKLPQAVRVADVDEDPTLELALLRLTGLEEAAARIGGGHESPLDAVIHELRSHFRTYDGWTVPMGKNRTVSCIIGYPQSKPMAYGRLTAATAEDWHGTVTEDRGAGRGVRVGVLDTRLYPHADLVSHYHAAPGALHPAGSRPDTAWAGHATFVAGLIATQAPAAALDVRAVLNDETGRASVWDTATAMASFANAGIDILNLSLGCRTSDGEPPLVLRRAVEVLSRRMVIVAAAGNHGKTGYPKAPIWPAALPDVVAVGASVGNEIGEGGKPEPADFSPQLPWLTCTAPGANVVSTFLSGTVRVPPTTPSGDPNGDPAKPDGPVEFEGYARWSGTSFAAASVSGAIAAATIPGEVTAAGALRRRLETPNPVVTPYG